MQHIKALQERRANIWGQVKALLDAAEGEKRDLTAEEDAQTAWTVACIRAVPVWGRCGGVGYQLTTTYPVCPVPPPLLCLLLEPPPAPWPAFAGMPSGRPSKVPRWPAVPPVFFSASPPCPPCAPGPCAFTRQLPPSHRYPAPPPPYPMRVWFLASLPPAPA